MGYLDISEVLSHGKRNREALQTLAQRCHQRLERAVATERASHRYTNRTGAAENSTQVRGQAVGVDVDIDVVMDVHYASYLKEGGWHMFDQRVQLALAANDSDVQRTARIAEG